MNIIDIKKVDYAYHKKQKVLNQISLKMSQGGIFGLLGVNGAGKSTLINLLTGQLKQSQGELQILQKTYLKQRTEILKDIALVPQGYAFYPRLTVIENLHFFASLRTDLSAVQQRIKEAVDFCQLQKVLDKSSQNLSGGFKRRLNLAIGLVNQPKLLFLDEPTVGIDPISNAFILEAIVKMKESGLSIVYTSHQMQEIEKLCQDVAILDKGKVLYQGNLAKLRQAGGYIIDIEINQVWKTADLQSLLKQYPLTIKENKLIGKLSPNIDLKHFNTMILDYIQQNKTIQLKKISINPASMEQCFFSLLKPKIVEQLNHV